MTQRILVGLLVVVLSLSSATQRPTIAQEESSIATRYIEMVAAGDAAVADTLIHPDYQATYERDDTLPGREAYKQRLVANRGMLAGCVEVQGVVRASATTDDGIVLVWAEIVCTEHSGRTLTLPLLAALELRDGMIYRVASATDDDYYIHQLNT